MPSERRHAQPIPPWESSILWVGRSLVLGLIAYSPWFYGMATWQQYWVLAIWSSLVLAVSAVVFAFGTVRKTWQPPWLLVSLAGLALMAVTQTLPLPNSIYNAAAPTVKFERFAREFAQQLPSADMPNVGSAAASSGLGEQTFSIYPVQTRCAQAVLAGAMAVFFSATVLFCDRLSRLALLVTLCATSTCVAILGIYQNVSWDDWTLLPGLRPTSFATFVSRNSAPQFLSFGIASCIALISIWKRAKDKQRQRSYHRRYPATTYLAKIRQVMEDLVLELNPVMVILLFVLAVHVVGVVAAASRGGFVSLLFAFGVTLVLFLVNNPRMIIAGVAGMSGIALGAAFLLGLFGLADQLSERMEDLDSSGRVQLWQQSLAQSQYWLSGSGLGTYRFAVMPVNPMTNSWPEHAENIFVEVAVEFGLIGALILGAAIWSLIRQLFPKEESRSMWLWPAAVYSATAIAVHSLVDFSVILPSIFVPLATLIGAFTQERNSAEVASQAPSKALAFVPVAIGLLLAIGYSSLTGFVQAEKIAKASAIDQVDSSIANSPLETSSLQTQHPEVVLALSRARLKQVERQLKAYPGWPEETSSRERDQYSSSEFVSAILRAPKPNERWQRWKTFFEQIPELRSQLQVCHEGFRFAAEGCAMDWRSQWGLFQTQVASDQAAVLQNWAKLNLLVGSIYDTQEVLATCTLVAGNHAEGIVSWRSVVERNSARAAGLAPLVETLLSVDDVLAILPANPQALAQLSRSLAQLPERKEFALKLCADIDRQQLVEQSQSPAELDVAAWVCNVCGDTVLETKTLERLAALRPQDAAVRVRLAKRYEAAGELAEAIRLVEQAIRRATVGADVHAYLEQLRKKGNEAPPE